MDAIIATNTTIARDNLAANEMHVDEQGGLSGKPLWSQSTHILGILAREVEGKIPLIGVGGIFSATDAREKVQAGATLVQLCSGFVYEGPALVTKCARALA